MSTFKVNYAGLRKPQKKVDSPTNPNSSTTTSNQPTARTNIQLTPPGSNASSATKLGQAGVLSMYQDNFQSENLEYIQNLLKTKASNNPDKSHGGQAGGAKKKGHLRTRSTLAGSAQIQPQVDSPEINSVGLSDAPLSKNNSKIDQLPYMKPDYDDGFAIGQDKDQLHESKDAQNGIEDDDEAPDTQRNITNTPTRHEGKLFDRYFKDDAGIGRRSMSLDDPRIDKKIFPKTTTNNRNTHRNPSEIDYYSMEKSLEEGSLQQDSTKHSNVSHKNEFLHSLNNFLSYFQKSENMSYRNMKAGQYFRANVGKSHRSVQKELDVSHQELRSLKSQVQELKHRVNELMSGNKYLTKELKHSNAREEENQQIFHKMQAEITHLKQKNRHYKTQCIQLQEAFKRERMESESNLLALKQVLANSINVALEHKNPPYPSGSKDKNLQSQYLVGDKKEKTSKSNLKDKRRTNGTLEGYESLYEMPSQYTRSKDLLETPKRDISGGLQYPYVTVSSEEGGEGLSNLETSSVMGYGLSYEGEGSKYQNEYQEELMKDQQIQFLQEKLAELMNSEEVSFSGQNSYIKSNSKTNRSKQGYKKNPSNLATPSYYVSRDRQGSLSKLSNLSVKYDTRDQRSIAVRDDYEESPSVNNGTERSFSMHNSD